MNQAGDSRRQWCRRSNRPGEHDLRLDLGTGSARFRGRVRFRTSCGEQFLLTEVVGPLGEIAPGASCKQGVIQPCPSPMETHEDGSQEESDAGVLENCEQAEEHQAHDERQHGQRPGDPPVARQLFLDRLDAQAKPAELAAPLVFAQRASAFPGRSRRW